MGLGLGLGLGVGAGAGVGFQKMRSTLMRPQARMTSQKVAWQSCDLYGGKSVR